ncbi:hypothetical protein HG536_0D01070 [Torulaspora globosa]|uniref:Bud emergence protein 1 n=1 Tax=Torulaspora globosa TaxID=48254 RepID=A0A7G3ZGE9_9SACH|nr:uncharacterized protein HG536_0D01070 [Torulaspora globosa]QLL32585.1 hypothetical protein HG536_0D01070 [Torulaspora globosa]
MSSPEMAIKALYSYQSQSPKELSFLEGEFFYVVREETEWFHASNPSTGKQGMVPKSYFEVIDKTRPRSSNASLLSRRSSHGQSKMGSLYAIVLYDFQAEKSDELTAYAGENLFICAHHNYEWFIAKPIGRLGGPGLVPVAFVSIVDIATGYATGDDVRDDINAVNMPTVQEWKGNIAKYKASNISLGSVEHHPAIAPSTQHSSTIFESGIITKASVDNFGLEDEKYWFEVHCTLSTGKMRRLKRSYQDFYDLQVKLLDSFPAESGKLRDANGQWTKRIMPYIPGPVPYVTDTITRKRKEDLNVYVKDLIMLPDYIAHSDMVRHLFSLRNNGFDHEQNMPQYNLSEKDGETAVFGSQADGLPQARPNEDNTLTGEDLKLYEKLSELSLSKSKPHSRPPSTQPPALKPTKIKFYYKDDIFALMLNSNITYAELRSKIAPRIDVEKFNLQVKLADGAIEDVTTDAQVAQIIQAKLKITVSDS